LRYAVDLQMVFTSVIKLYGVLTVNDGNEPKGKNLYLFTYGKVNN